MKQTDNAIFMEPEEYEAYLQEQERIIEETKLKNEEVKNNAQTLTMSLYELNQSAISSLPILNEDEVRKCAAKILKWLNNNADKYYMLLCHELHYYTLFHITTSRLRNDYAIIVSRGAQKILTDELIDVLLNLGDIRVIEEDTNGAMAIWSSFKPEHYDMLSDEAKEEANKVHCFYLFPYGGGVIEI